MKLVRRRILGWKSYAYVLVGLTVGSSIGYSYRPDMYSWEATVQLYAAVMVPLLTIDFFGWLHLRKARKELVEKTDIWKGNKDGT